LLPLFAKQSLVPCVISEIVWLCGKVLEDGAVPILMMVLGSEGKTERKWIWQGLHLSIHLRWRSDRRAESMAEVSDPAYRDYGWYGYDPRAMAVVITTTAVISWGVWLGRWYFEDLSGLANHLGALAVFVLAWGVWPWLAAVFFYRTVTYTYRLTDRAVLVDFGFWHPYQPPLPLSDIRQVVIRRGVFGRFLGIGTVEIRTASRRLVLPGVRHPDAFVQRLQQLRARELSPETSSSSASSEAGRSCSGPGNEAAGG
jgi:membrane protein YdbS with pleckstrin-like domain